MIDRPGNDNQALPGGLIGSLRRMGLVAAGENPTGAPLAGGVSSDIWRVDLSSDVVCVKSALPQLKVAAEWYVPTERNVYELRWFETVGRIVPNAVPAIRGRDDLASAFAMDYLDPARYPVWKSQLGKGLVDLNIARAVGETLVTIHAATAGVEYVRCDFASDDIFRSIRLEPYLVAAARVHPDRSQALQALFDTTAKTRLALVHGDVSPKNILAGPLGPVFLDAECAWYGDPAFDLAFCLNHLLLKCMWVPTASSALLEAYGVLAAAYLRSVSWEDPAGLEERVARLLPGLLLARVDGKSPVEYLTDQDKVIVRRSSRALLAEPVQTLHEVSTALIEEIRHDERPH
jgi:aminoglycoside phosphotransferase (APT) family kinase protein